MISSEYNHYLTTATHYNYDLYLIPSRWIFNVIHGVVVGYGLATLASKTRLQLYDSVC